MNNPLKDVAAKHALPVEAAAYLCFVFACFAHNSNQVFLFGEAIAFGLCALYLLIVDMLKVPTK